MLDIQFIRDNSELVQDKSNQKGYKVDVSRLLALDEQRRHLLSQIEQIRQERNALADSTKDSRPDDEQIALGKDIKKRLLEHEQKIGPIDQSYYDLLLSIPNLPTDDVPVGSSEEDNKIIRRWGEPIQFDFPPKNHWQLGQKKGFIDKERAAKVAGSRFAYLKGDLVMLEFALWQFALSVVTNEHVLEKIIQDNNLDIPSKPFTPVLPPAVANTKIYESTGRLNKEEQTYKLADDDLWLNASAEHVLAPMYAQEIIQEDVLPIRLAGYTTAFRREAGTYGKDMEGILRLHQFNKLELEIFSVPEQSLDEHLFLIAIQEYLMQQLGLPYQVIMKCTADIGFPNARGVDIDVWLPGQGQYRETHTADYMTDYQARRMQTRLRRLDGHLEYVHTNDATAFSERPLAAILENFQTRDGHIVVPEVLRPYLGGRSEL